MCVRGAVRIHTCTCTYVLGKRILGDVVDKRRTPPAVEALTLKVYRGVRMYAYGT